MIAYTVYDYESQVMNTYTHTHTVNENCFARQFLSVYKCNLRRKGPKSTSIINQALELTLNRLYCTC